MIKEFLLGSAVAVCVAGQASALTVSLLEDNRFTEAEAFAGENSDFAMESPDSPFAPFVSKIGAFAMEFGDVGSLIGDTEVPGYGATASASASQISQVTATTISVNGSAFAEGNHGDEILLFAQSDSNSLIGFGSFSAYGESALDILFSIDEAAEYDLQAFLSAGTELALGKVGNDVANFAEMVLHNEDTDETVFGYEVSDDVMEIDESGVIGPGTYRFTASAYAEVFGDFFDIDSLAGDADQVSQQNDFGYQTSARFGGIGLKLIAADQPIPEPVTTSLIGLGLGALALQTSRRRRA